ncbi:MAG: UDP-N-acetylmuramoyl-L-alanyl-D-glutamate--2,6-diaminopimelate ligase [Pseudomonadota bacterium]
MARIEIPEIRLREVTSLRHAGAPDVSVCAISDDSREVDGATLFFARQTLSAPADRFVADALERGAAAVLGAGLSPAPAVIDVDRPEEALGDIVRGANGWGHDLFSITAVTGTNGKTTVSHLIAGLAGAENDPVGVIGTLGWGLWSPRASYEPAGNTTPGLIDNWRLIMEMVRAGAREIVMEVSSHALAQGRVEGLPIRTGVFTNLGRDHFDYHGDVEAYLAAKAHLFTLPTLRQAVLNAEQDASRTLLETIRAREDAPRLLCYALDHGRTPETCRPCLTGEMQTTPEGRMRLSVDHDSDRGLIETRLAGRFNAENLLAALAARLVVGESLEDLVDRATRLSAPPGRMESFMLAGDRTVVVDYAHSPDALENVLASLREGLPEGARLGVAFGCGGDRDRGKRPEMGAIAERLADWVVVTSDNPRSEDPEAIIREIRAGMEEPDTAETITGRRQAIRHAIERLAAGVAGDCLLVAGKGHETGQEIAEQVLPFDDREVVRQAIAEVST